MGREERVAVANETKLAIINMNIEDDPACKVLFMILDTYCEDGEPVETTLYLKKRYDRSRKIIVNLYNDEHRRDTVLIKPLTSDEIMERLLAQPKPVPKK